MLKFPFRTILMYKPNLFVKEYLFQKKNCGNYKRISFFIWASERCERI